MIIDSLFRTTTGSEIAGDARRYVASASRDEEQWLGLTTYQLFAPITVGVD
jgi:hypothetical protein